jgi:hypothetical protein
MSHRIVFLLVAIAAGIIASRPDAAAQKRNVYTAPETFSSPMQARTESGAAAATVRIQIDRYTPEGDRKAMTDAMTHGGYPAFVQALRKAPAVGHVEIGDQRFTLRWTREQQTPKGRAISLVTDSPVFFIGGGRVDAKPRQGFELAVVQLAVDDFGLGTGTMAAAARVKADGSGGVVIEDYANEPIKLTSVYRVIK